MNSNFILCDWQYESVRKLAINDFYIGQVVFITCNPKNPLVITNVIKDKVQVQNIFGKKTDSIIPFMAILPYKYAALVVYKGVFKVCLN